MRLIPLIILCLLAGCFGKKADTPPPVFISQDDRAQEEHHDKPEVPITPETPDESKRIY